MENSVQILNIVYALILARLVAVLFLDYLNAKEAAAHPETIPEDMVGEISPEDYAKSVEYTVTKTRFHSLHAIWETMILMLILSLDVLPAIYQMVIAGFGASIYAQAGFLVITGFVLSIPDIPFELWSQFRIEERFGFNKSSFKLWVSDQIKGMAVGLIIGYPILLMLLGLVTFMGANWWLYAFLFIFVFQIFLLILFPRVLLPLFNKLENLEEGSLKDRLVQLANKVSFPVSNIQVMDGSKIGRAHV